VRKYEPSNTTSAVELGKLQAKHDKQRAGLVRWCQTNFGEAYFLWVHLKAIQCYVESILRYGLPADFDVVLMQVRERGEGSICCFRFKIYLSIIMVFMGASSFLLLFFSGFALLLVCLTW
jgi:hypothetical protein